MISVHMADKYALKISQNLPGAIFIVFIYSEMTSHLAPCSFACIQEDVTPEWYPNKRWQHWEKYINHSYSRNGKKSKPFRYLEGRDPPVPKVTTPTSEPGTKFFFLCLTSWDTLLRTASIRRWSSEEIPIVRSPLITGWNLSFATISGEIVGGEYGRNKLSSPVTKGRQFTGSPGIANHWALTTGERMHREWNIQDISLLGTKENFGSGNRLSSSWFNRSW